MPTPIHCFDIKNALTNALEPGSVITIRCCKHSTASAGSLFLKENMLLYAQEGGLTFSHGKETYEVKQHQVALLKKDILLGYNCEARGAAFIIFVLKADLVLEFAKLAQLRISARETTQTVLIGHPGAGLFQYMASLQPYLQEGISIAESLVKIKLLELLFCLSGEDQQIFGELLNVNEYPRPNITGIVEENIMNPLSLSQLARLTGRSESSFRRDFLSIYNMPPSRWIRLKRLEKAQELLVSTNMTITSICYTLGFESIAHFSRIFKSRFGYPPSGVRISSFIA